MKFFKCKIENKNYKKLPVASNDTKSVHDCTYYMYNNYY